MAVPVNKTKTCKHFCVGFICGQAHICLFEQLPLLCRSYGRMYWVGVGETPKEEILKIHKMFSKYKYCPKCGEKLDFAGQGNLFE